MQAVRASVKPHAISPETGEVLALEDAVESWIERDARGLILVSGGVGSGRTTAIRHLAAVLPPRPHLRFVDHSELLLDEIDSKSISGLLVIASIGGVGDRKPSGEYVLADYRLANWSMDDVIEYLVSCWPERCASVVSRLETADEERDGETASLYGCPAVWRIALDRMAKNDTVASPVDAVLQEIATVVGSPEQLSALQDLCLFLVTRRVVLKGLSDVVKGRPEISRLTATGEIRMRLAAESVASTIRGKGSLLQFCPPLPAHVVQRVARLVDEPIASRLEAIVAEPQSSPLHPTAVSILVAAFPCWRPEKKPTPNLDRAVLDGVRWDGVDLTAASLSRASLVNAHLAGADLAQAKMGDADLQSSDLREANLTSVFGVHADFSEADLRGVVAQSAYFTFATFEGATLDSATLDHSMFGRASLKQALLRGASLQEANLMRAVVDDADFSGAVFDAAKLDLVRLAGAKFAGASFYGASLRLCDLEFIDPGSGMDFRSACLNGAHLTGAQLPNARMAGADLGSTGLADINLEGADLRGARMDLATFHMGSSRSGQVDSPLASEGTRTGFYTDEYEEQHYRDPEEVRKANLRGADLTDAKVKDADFYLVDLRGAIYSEDQRRHFERCGAILD
jgi:uncharacterized protein YjbI with pentapeptide repeats